jgi:hypothetical protein
MCNKHTGFISLQPPYITTRYCRFVETLWLSPHPLDITMEGGTVPKRTRDCDKDGPNKASRHRNSDPTDIERERDLLIYQRSKISENIARLQRQLLEIQVQLDALPLQPHRADTLSENKNSNRSTEDHNNIFFRCYAIF